jgi:phytoene dehydrogenase-like protein
MSSTLHGQHFDTIILGAGMSGLAAGIRLALYDKRVLILERHTRPGGLNSYYHIGKRRFDVGLHAVTNYAPPGARGVPFASLLRQLRLRHDDFALAPQLASEIHHAGKRVRFTNDPAFFASEIAREFPAQIDAFLRLDAAIRAIRETALDAPPGSAREFVAAHLADPVLADLLFLPTSYYGSARENDVDLPQFAILWKSLFHEGFSRPLEGVRVIIRALLRKYLSLGGTLRLNSGVRKLHTDARRVTAIELDDGTVLTADTILSSAGIAETHALCAPENTSTAYAPAATASATATASVSVRASPCSSVSVRVPSGPASAPTRHPLSFCEAITVLRQPPATAFNWDATIIFFNDAERFHYAATTDFADLRSGVICLPNNYAYPGGTQLPEGWLRVTTLAGAAAWKTLRAADPAAYAAAKREYHTRLNATARAHLPAVAPAAFDAAVVERDMFTPPTVERFTGHISGTIYGSPEKSRDGRTPLANLFICGTDQGFLGIVGAMLSGVSMANLHILKESLKA